MELDYCCGHLKQFGPVLWTDDLVLVATLLFFKVFRSSIHSEVWNVSSHVFRIFLWICMYLLSTFYIVLKQCFQISNGGLDPADLEYVAYKFSSVYKWAQISICTVDTTYCMTASDTPSWNGQLLIRHIKNQYIFENATQFCSLW